MPILDGSVILITGGAGSLGLALVKEIFKFSQPKAVRLLDSSEYFLYKAYRTLKEDARLRILLGDIRDKQRVTMAMADVDYVIHCAAIKSVDIAAFNPIEAITVNVNGVINLIVESLHVKPKKMLCLSSDKAVFYERLNVYAATKFLDEELMKWADEAHARTKYASIRMGNFIDSRMSVFETWRDQEKRGQALTLTDEGMVRWFISLEKAAEYTLQALEIMEGGEIFVAPGEEKRVLDLIGKRPYRITGRRTGERLREILMSPEEEKMAVKKGPLWALGGRKH